MLKLFIYYIIRSFVAWQIIFVAFKAFFLIFHFDKFSSQPTTQIFKTFFKSFALDISATSYLLILPFLFSLLHFFIGRNWIIRLYKFYLIIFAFLISFLNVADTFLVDFWSSKISLKALSFIAKPVSVVATMGMSDFLFDLFLVACHFILAYSVFKGLIFKKNLVFKKKPILFFMYSLMIAFGLIVGMRGGFQNIPINQSSTYFSTNNILNLAGVNPFWNFMNTLVQNNKYLNENPYIKMDQLKAKAYVRDLFEVENDSIILLFNKEDPNIVYIALEGINANVFKSFNGVKSYAPKIDSLFKHGYLFKEMYSAGFRSDQGMVAIYSGFPPAPISSIVAQPEKFYKLPCMTSELIENQYNCSYFMGVEPEFGNLKSYLVYNGFDKLVDIKDFPKSQRTSSLGVPDQFLFQKFLSEMNNISEPFYSMIFTATTHEPFDMPFNDGVEDEAQRYLNTVAYLDTVLNTFLNQVKQMPWYDNTVFIISSDHAHSHPNNYYYNENERYHIPFFIFGNPLKKKFKGLENNKICSQIDIPKTILNQLKINSSDFNWSKDLMNPKSKEFAFYTYVEGYVLKTSQCNNGWEYRYDKPYGSFESVDSLFCKEQGQAFLQELYNTYLSY